MTNREIDAAIHSKMLGKPAFMPELLHRLGRHVTGENGTACLICGIPDVRDDIHGMCLPRYSTDISAAWSVVEKLKDMDPPSPGYHFTLSYDDQWVAGWYQHEMGWDVFAEAREAPLAICKFALKACGVEI